MLENFERTHIAIPLPDEMYFAWTVYMMRFIEKGRFPELKGRFNPPHITIYHLGTVNIDQLAYAQSVVKEKSSQILGSELRVMGLKIIGEQNNQALVIGIENTERLREFRSQLEGAMPEFAGHNLPLHPHLTISELKSRRSIKRARKMVLQHLPNRDKSVPFKIGDVQVIYQQL